VLVASAVNSSIGTAGSVGMRGGQTATFDNFNASAVVLTSTNLNTPFNDTFGTAGQLGGPWDDRLGNFTVEDTGFGLEARSTINASSLSVLRGVNDSDVSVQGAIRLVQGSGLNTGLIARYSGVGDDNLYWATIRSVGSTGFATEIWKNVNGTWTQLANKSITVNLTPPSTLLGTIRFTVVGSSLKFFLNDGTGDRLIASAVDSSLTSGSVGIRGSAAYTDFTASRLTAGTLASLATPFTDGFDTPAAPGQLNTPWAERLGNFGVTGSQTQSTINATSLAILNGINESNVNVSAGISLRTDQGLNAGLTARYSGTGDDNLYMATVRNVSGTFTTEIWKNVNGTWTNLANRSVTGVTLTSGVLVGTIRFEVVGTSLKFYLADNGPASERLIAYAQDASLVSGSVGLRGSAVYTDFTASRITPATVTTLSPPYSTDFTTPGSGPLGIPTQPWADRVGNFTVGNITDPNDGTAPNGTGVKADVGGSLSVLRGLSVINSTVEAQVRASVGGIAALVQRYSGVAEDNFYMGLVRSSTAGPQLEIWRNLNGNWTLLNSTPPGSAPLLTRTGKLVFIANGSTLTLEMYDPTGTTLRASITATDTTLKSGSVGIRGAAGSTFDNFVAQ